MRDAHKQSCKRAACARATASCPRGAIRGVRRESRFVVVSVVGWAGGVARARALAAVAAAPVAAAFRAAGGAAASECPAPGVAGSGRAAPGPAQLLHPFSDSGLTCARSLDDIDLLAVGSAGGTARAQRQASRGRDAGAYQHWAHLVRQRWPDRLFGSAGGGGARCLVVLRRARRPRCPSAVEQPAGVRVTSARGAATELAYPVPCSWHNGKRARSQ